jgi:Fe-S oxidoreductase
MSLSPYRKYERTPFDNTACTECGLCFQHCPVLHLSVNQAKIAITELKDSTKVQNGHLDKISKKVLKSCTSCMACNQICPTNARPANLILDIWYNLYQKEKLPLRAEYFLPLSRPNFRTDILKVITLQEKNTIKKWAEQTPVKEILFSGCNLITSSYLTWSKIFDGIEIRGTLDYCCGEMLFRMGLYDQVTQIAARLTDYFQNILQVKKIWLLCTAGYNMLTNILPQFGADFRGIEFKLFQKELLRRLESNELRIVKPFHKEKVTIQDSCHGKMINSDFFEIPRKIVQKLGLTVIEAEHAKCNNLCCGIGGGFSHAASYQKWALIQSMYHTFRMHAKAPSDYTCVYCSGCLEMLSCARWVNWSTKPVYHLLELIQLAIGEKPARKQGKLGILFFINALIHQKISSRPFKIPVIPIRPIL